MIKRDLREKYMRKRRSLAAAEAELLSKQICKHFIQDFDLAAFRVIHTYLPIVRNNEPDTWCIIRYIEGSGMPTRIAVPRISSDHGELEHLYLDDETHFVTNAWGIEEPVSSHVTPVSEIDAVLVPLLAFDKTGERVGYGKGYYDRFLGRCRPDTKRIGISFFPPVERIDDTNEFDEPLDCCITPDGTIRF